VRLGDKVRLRSLNMQGVITSLGEEEAEVQVGNLRVRARASDLELPGSLPVEPLPLERKAVSAPASEKSAVAGVRSPGVDYSPSPGLELDLRGRRAEDALDALDRYLDSAYLAGLLFVRIIHGKGTGRLRQAVREALSQHPHVRSFESGSEKEGGDGVTVAKLATN
jgi:DNA mismatch repair protein MutS2